MLITFFSCSDLLFLNGSHFGIFLFELLSYPYICRATMRPPRPSSTAECLRLIARLRGEQASAASWEPRPPFEATEMD